MIRKAPSLVHCDFCGGPAVWCVIGGDLCYHCRRQCDGFMQLELSDDGGVSPSMRGSEADDHYHHHGPDQGLPF